MIANIQRLITLGLLSSALAWALYFWQRGEVVWAWVGALMLVFGYTIFLALEFALLAFRQDSSSRVPRASRAQLIRAWWGEILTAPLVFCWRQPFRASAVPNHLPVHAAGRRGVVLVHGFFCNRALWNPWMVKLRASDTPFVAVSLEPPFGSIDTYTNAIDDAVTQIKSVTGLAPIIVAHSMGGLAVRAWLAKTVDDASVHHVITIGTPHHGTWLARFGQTRNARQMRIQSPWLLRLAAIEPPSSYTKFTCFFSHCDNIVFPASTATLTGAANRHVPGAAHVQLAFHGEIFTEMQHRLGQSTESPQHAELADAPPALKSNRFLESTKRPG
ncbi:MAG: alpha/beta fold hydrolase [Nitrospira sp.]|nr:alpha/beta fold hydrolase [Nitrospira sp.]